MISFIACLGVASDEIPGAPQSQPIAIVGATIHPIEGKSIEGGMILFDKGKIVAIGKNVELPDGSRTIDAHGKHVYPGLIDAVTNLGLVEINSIRATIDHRETGSINPNVRAWVAINPDSEIIPVTRANGILIGLVVPTGGLLSGRSAAIQLDGWTWEEMLIKPDIGLHVQWPRPRSGDGTSGDSTSSQTSSGDGITELRRAFDMARAYRLQAEHASSTHRVDARWESMRAVLDGDVPLFVHANEIRQIQSAVAFSVEQKVKMVLVGGYDAPYVADLLKQYKIPVIVTGTYRLPQRESDNYDDPYTLPERLRKAQVPFCLASEGRFGATGVRNLPFHAANAVAYGLPRDQALRSITLDAAKILGIDDRVGSLQVGKDATLLVTDGDPLDVKTVIDRAYIQGRAVDLNHRHLRLWKKYQAKYGLEGSASPPP